ncbi:hypothetical protein [Ammoniphilus sp. 3BR4]|uniref:hypothetical protein n=1 Tax=Ammoniphilus sp. 3BR4 TaxID=3158265 RepID=UPI00346590FB
MAAEYKEMEYIESGKMDVSQLKALDPETSRIMKSEFSASLKLGLVYFLFIFSIPVLNWFAKDFMMGQIWGGMTISWFLTAIVGLALAVVIAVIHIYLYEKRLKVNQPATHPVSDRETGRSAG